METKTIQKLESSTIQCDVCKVPLDWSTAYEYCGAVVCVKCDAEDSSDYVQEFDMFDLMDDD